MKRTILYILLCLALLGAFFTSPLIVTAQGGGWSYTFNFLVDDGGFTTHPDSDVTPTHSAGIGWEDGLYEPTAYRSIDLRKTLTAVDVTSASMVYNVTLGDQGAFTPALIVLRNSGSDVASSDSSIASGNNQTKSVSYTGTIDGIDIFITPGNGTGSGDPGGSSTLKSVILFGEGACPFDECDEFTNNGTPGAPLPSQFCAILGTNNANFRDPHNWTFSSGATYANTDPDYGLELPPGGSAALNIPLSPSSKYRFQVAFEALQEGDNGSFTVKIGTSEAYSIPVQSHTNAQVYTQGAVAYSPDSGGNYTITIARPSTDTGDIAISFFCLIKDTDAPTDADPGDGGSVDSCEVCDPPLGITDITGIINWIICNIRRMFNCWLIPALANWLGYLVALVRYFLGFVRWILNLAEGAVNFVSSLIGAVAGFVNGIVTNVAAFINNGFHSSGIASATNNIMSGVRDLPTAIANGISTFGGQLSDIFLTSTSLIELIVRLIGLAASTVAYIIGLIPLVWQSLIDGFNSSGVPVSGGPTCTTPGELMYYPCYGFYILDNTIFSGPGRWLIPILMGLIAIDFLTWALHRIKEELSK